MNYLKQYIKLVRTAQTRNSGVEEHHIFPRSIYGENDYKVMLTMREHWLAHKLLFHIFLKRYGNHDYTYKMANAVRLMCNRTSREYEIARSYFIDNHHTKTEEGRKQISQRMTGVKNPQWGKPAHNRGKQPSIKTIQKNRDAHVKKYKITFTSGETCVIVNMKNFSEVNNYNSSHLIQISKGNRKRHKDIIGVTKL